MHRNDPGRESDKVSDLPQKRSLFPGGNDTVRGLVVALVMPALSGGVGWYVGGSVQEERLGSLSESFRAHRQEGHGDMTRELVQLQTRFDALQAQLGETREDLRLLRAKVEALDNMRRRQQ